MKAAIITRTRGDLRVFTGPDDVTRCTLCTEPRVTQWGALVQLVRTEGEEAELKCTECGATGWFVVKWFKGS